MTIEEAREYWCRRLERAEGYSDEHWPAEERHAHKDYVDAMTHAVTALAICREHEEVKQPKSNADRIRQMTDEELAKFLCLVKNKLCFACAYTRIEDCTGIPCESARLEWLRKEVIEDAGTERTEVLTMDELKPCPFCGDIQYVTHVELSNGLHYIECKRCGAAPHRLGAWDYETAVKYWNSANRWIPCSERLPEQGERVIVAIFGSDMIMPNEGETLQDAIERSRKEGYITVGFIGSDGWYGADWFPLMVQPSYWMPKPDLPEPPESEVQDDEPE